MTRVDPGGGSGPYVEPTSNGSPDGNIQVDPGVWNEASYAIQINNNVGADIQADMMRALNGALDSLNVLSFIEGASDLAQALDDFSRNIELSLACLGTDLIVVSSGLAAAAAAFGSLDSALASTFTDLESQMSYFTTETTLTSDGAMPYSPVKVVGEPNSPGSGGGLSISPEVAKELGIDLAKGTAVAAGGAAVLWLLLVVVAAPVGA